MDWKAESKSHKSILMLKISICSLYLSHNIIIMIQCIALWYRKGIGGVSKIDINY